jgi:hypothetical protein
LSWVDDHFGARYRDLAALSTPAEPLRFAQPNQELQTSKRSGLPSVQASWGDVKPDSSTLRSGCAKNRRSSYECQHSERERLLTARYSHQAANDPSNGY